MIGSGTLKAECKKMIEECGLIQNIDLLGFQKNPYKIIKNCNIVVMPSKEEGFGLTAIESVVLNKIVINSGVGGLLEIFKNTDFISKTLEEYYSKIIYIIDNNVKLEAYTQNSILNKFTNLDDWYRKIKSIYEN